MMVKDSTSLTVQQGKMIAFFSCKFSPFDIGNRACRTLSCNEDILWRTFQLLADIRPIHIRYIVTVYICEIAD